MEITAAVVQARECTGSTSKFLKQSFSNLFFRQVCKRKHICLYIHVYIYICLYMSISISVATFVSAYSLFLDPKSNNKTTSLSPTALPQPLRSTAVRSVFHDGLELTPPSHHAAWCVLHGRWRCGAGCGSGGEIALAI